MNYLITGGAGFIGSNIAARLADKHEVIVIDNLSSGKITNLGDLKENPNFTFIEGEYYDEAILKNILDNVDGIFHQAAIASVPKSIEKPLTTNTKNLDGTLSLLKFASDYKIKKLVFASSAAVYGNNPALPKSENMMPEPLSPYAVQKLSAEYYCSVFSNLYELDTICLRYFNVYGPKQDPKSEYAAVIPKFITNLLNKEPLTIYGDGRQTRDFIFIDDVVRANTTAMKSRETGIFNIAGGKETSLNELAQRLMEITGFETGINYSEEREGDVRRSLADISKTNKILGFNPQFNLKDGLKKTVEYFS